MSILSGRLMENHMAHTFDGESVPTTVRLPESLLKAVDRWLPALGSNGKPMTRAEFVRTSIYDQLRKLEAVQAKLKEISNDVNAA